MSLGGLIRFDINVLILGFGDENVIGEELEDALLVSKGKDLLNIMRTGEADRRTLTNWYKSDIEHHVADACESQLAYLKINRWNGRVTRRNTRLPPLLRKYPPIGGKLRDDVEEFMPLDCMWVRDVIELMRTKDTRINWSRLTLKDIEHATYLPASRYYVRHGALFDREKLSTRKLGKTLGHTKRYVKTAPERLHKFDSSIQTPKMIMQAMSVSDFF